MNNQIVDIEANIERIKEFMEFSSSKLDFNNTKVVLVQDEFGNLTSPLHYYDAINEIINLHKNHLLEISSANGIRLLNELPKKMIDIKEKLDQSFEELIKIVDVQNEALENLKEQIIDKETEIKEKEDRIEQLKEEMQNNRYDSLQNQVTNLTNILLQNQSSSQPRQNDSKHPDTFFTDNIDEKIGENPDKVIENSKTELIQKLHTELLEILKVENLYPLHKVNPEKAKKSYIEAWQFSLPNYPDLTIEDYPTFIDNLEDFASEDDNYLDSVEAE